jgi:hypothetical protein
MNIFFSEGVHRTSSAQRNIHALSEEHLRKGKSPGALSQVRDPTVLNASSKVGQRFSGFNRQWHTTKRSTQSIIDSASPKVSTRGMQEGG